MLKMRTLVKDKLKVATDTIKSLCVPHTEASASPLPTGELQLVWGSLGAISAPCLGQSGQPLDVQVPNIRVLS